MPLVARGIIARNHCPKLEAHEAPAQITNPLLAEQNGSFRNDANNERNANHHRQDNREGQNDEHDVQDTLPAGNNGYRIQARPIPQFGISVTVLHLKHQTAHTVLALLQTRIPTGWYHRPGQKSGRQVITPLKTGLEPPMALVKSAGSPSIKTPLFTLSHPKFKDPRLMT